MDASRSRSKPTGKHEWNSLENYGFLTERHLEKHPLIESHDVALEILEVDDQLIVAVYGTIHCRNGVILEVEKYAETKVIGGRTWVRMYSYRYNAYLPGKCTVLRYDNGHAEDEYHVHPFDPQTGEAAKEGKLIARNDMPHLSEVLDEIAELAISN